MVQLCYNIESTTGAVRYSYSLTWNEVKWDYSDNYSLILMISIEYQRSQTLFIMKS